MPSFSSNTKYAVVVRDMPVVFPSPWFYDTLEEAQARYDECRTHIKPQYAERVELLELVRVA